VIPFRAKPRTYYSATASPEHVIAHVGQPDRGAAMFSPRVWRKIGRWLRLSCRELEIVCGAFDDLTEATIAANLGISSHTVHTHIKRLHCKLGVSDRVQLILRVVNTALKRQTASCPEASPPGASAGMGRHRTLSRGLYATAKGR
jgi:DNA-binding NarL/FixJ family response regulator